MQQKRKRISFKNHKFVKTKEDELIITKNNHMEIISKEQFERVQDIIKHTYYACSSYVRKRECNNKNTLRKDILEKKVIKEINDRQAIKIDKLNRKYIFDLINMIYLNQDGSIKIEFKRK